MPYTLPSPTFDTGLVWFRRDLRTTDHAALQAAIARCRRVFCAFVFDTDILDPLLAAGLHADRRVEFIHLSLQELDGALRAHGGGLLARHGRAVEVVPALAAALGAQAVFANHDYEPAAIARDAEVGQRLAADSRVFLTFKDQVVLERGQVLTAQGTPFSVFTPYRRAWLRTLTADDLAPRDTSGLPQRLAALPEKLDTGLPTLEDMGFARSNLVELDLPAGMSGAEKLFDNFRSRMSAYRDKRDFPAQKGPSYLSVHLRFGTISIRALAREAHALMLRGDAGAETWLSELIWREFYFQILHHHPRLAAGASFRPEYDRIEWESGAGADALFAAWCEGRTGYPLVDAAMLQLNRTGYMHNRLRMVTACFLIKDLGIDWRRGEAYFAQHLNDFDFAANNGGWQWAASSGCDAQPYFRIFNPVTQSEKFDTDGAFIRRYLPALAGLPDKLIHAPWRATPMALQGYGLAPGIGYPPPVVDHDTARKRTLARYAVVKSQREDPQA